MKYLLPFLLAVTLHAHEPENPLSGAAHIGVTLLATVGINQLLYEYTDMYSDDRIMLSATLGLLPGLSKEWIDMANGGYFSWSDMIYNEIGTFIFLVWQF